MNESYIEVRRSYGSQLEKDSAAILSRLTGNKYGFHETFHDNGEIPMAEIMKLYQKCGVDVPIRVDHVPLMAGEKQETAGYTALGRLYAIGYLKGILESV